MKASDLDRSDRVAANLRFAADVDRLALKYRCEDCVHGAAGPTCSLGYPNACLVGAHQLLDPSGMLTFCKYFELGE